MCPEVLLKCIFCRAVCYDKLGFARSTALAFSCLPSQGTSATRRRSRWASPLDYSQCHDTIADNKKEEFRPFLDEAIILSILLDYPGDLIGARNVLAQIAENVFVEQASGFDPSGQSGEADHAGDGDTETVASATDSLGITTQASSEPPAERSRAPAWTSETRPVINNGVAEAAIAALRGVFPSLKDIDITQAIRDAEGDLDRAVEQLQNLQFLEESGERPKGVDGFFREAEEASTGKSRRGEKKSRLAASYSGTVRPPPAPLGVSSLRG
jgi:hypothetical protein